MVAGIHTGVVHDWPIARSARGKGTKAVVKAAVQRQSWKERRGILILCLQYVGSRRWYVAVHLWN